MVAYGAVEAYSGNRRRHLVEGTDNKDVWAVENAVVMVKVVGDSIAIGVGEAYVEFAGNVAEHVEDNESTGLVVVMIVVEVVGPENKPVAEGDGWRLIRGGE